MTTRAEIVAEANTWVDVRFRHAGRDRSGLDCVGLVIKTAHGCGISEFDTVNYPRRPNAGDFRREMRDHLQRVPKDEARSGSILVMRSPVMPCHTAILEDALDGQSYIIHAYAPYRKVVRQPVTKDVWDKVVMCFDYKGLDD